jgi:hypothetical protein
MALLRDALLRDALLRSGHACRFSLWGAALSRSPPYLLLAICNLLKKV